LRTKILGLAFLFSGLKNYLELLILVR